MPPRARSTSGWTCPTGTRGRSPSAWPRKPESSCRRASSTAMTAPITCALRSCSRPPDSSWPPNGCAGACLRAEPVITQPLVGERGRVLLVDIGFLVHAHQVGRRELAGDRVPDVRDLAVDLRGADDRHDVVGVLEVLVVVEDHEVARLHGTVAREDEGDVDVAGAEVRLERHPVALGLQGLAVDVGEDGALREVEGGDGERLLGVRRACRRLAPTTAAGSGHKRKGEHQGWEGEADTVLAHEWMSPWVIQVGVTAVAAPTKGSFLSR